MSKWGSMKRDEGGAAVVETALCLCFVVLPLVFATIAYAYMLSFRQTVSQSVAEGVRAAAVAPASATTQQRKDVAIAAVTAAMKSGPGGLTCSSAHVTCKAEPLPGCGNGSGTNCMKVTVSYPYKDHALLPMPGLGFAMPSTITYTAVAEVS